MSDARITLSAEDKTRAAFADVKRNLIDLRNNGEQINRAFGLMAGTLGSAFAGVSLTAFLRATVDGIDRLNDIKDATGASIEGISALEDVAARTGTTIDVVSASLLKFNSTLGDAKAGSAGAEIFKALGLDVAELKRLDPAEALRQTAVALTGFADDGNKARLVQELFGKTVREVAPFLNDLAAAGQLNATVTKQQVQEAEKFNQQLAALGKNSTDLARTLSSGLVSVLVDFTNRLTTAQKVFGGFSGILATGGTGLAFFSEASQGLREYNAQIAQVDASIKRVKENPRSSGFGPLLDKQAMADLEKQRADLVKFAEYYRTVLNIGSAGQGRGDFMQLPKLPDLPDKDRRVSKPRDERPAEVSVTPISDSLKDALRLIDQTDNSKLGTLRLQLAELTDMTAGGLASPGVYQAIFGVVRQINMMDPAYRKAIDDQTRLNELLAATPTGQLEKQRNDMRLLAEAYEDGRLGLVGSEEAARNFGEAVKDALGDVKGTAGEMDEFSKEAARNIQSTLGSTLKATLKGDFDSIGELWGNLLLDMAAEAAAAQLGRFLLGDFGKTGSIGGLLGSGLSFLAGIGRADGGPVGATSIQRVNERGFEVFTDPMGKDWLMTGARGGYVTPHNQVAVAGAAAPSAPVSQVNHVSIGAGVQRGEVYAMLQMGLRDSEARMYRLLKDQRVIA